MEKELWQEDPYECKWCNAVRYFRYDTPRRRYYCLLIQREDGKWYAYTSQIDASEEEINQNWVPLDVKNLREAKRVVEVMAKME